MSNIKQIFYSCFSSKSFNSAMQNNHELKFHRLNKKQRHQIPRGKCFVRLLKLDKEINIFCRTDDDPV